ncbi:MAG: outer membrane beta-barrel protein [Candidatus Solibacter sp.]
MRPLSLLLPALFLTAAAAFSQPISFGVKGGMPMTDFIDAASSGKFTASTVTNRYIVGPTVELRLPFGLGVEADVLYRHFNYRSAGITAIGANAASIVTDTSSGAWEFPLLAKYRFKGKLVRPFIDAGVSWDKISGVTQAVKTIVNNVTSSSTTSNPFELQDGVTRGFVLGAGIDLKVLVIHISPEVRFTRWGAKHFIDPAGLINSKQNQAEFLVGFTF